MNRLYVYYLEGGEELSRAEVHKEIDWKQGDELHISNPIRLTRGGRSRLTSLDTIHKCMIEEVHPVVVGVQLVRVRKLPKIPIPPM